MGASRVSQGGCGKSRFLLEAPSQRLRSLQKNLTTEDTEELGELLFPLEAITATSIFCHLLGHFQERSAGVRQAGFLPVHEAQLALKMEIAHLDADQITADDL